MAAPICHDPIQGFAETLVVGKRGDPQVSAESSAEQRARVLGVASKGMDLAVMGSDLDLGGAAAKMVDTISLCKTREEMANTRHGIGVRRSATLATFR